MKQVFTHFYLVPVEGDCLPEIMPRQRKPFETIAFHPVLLFVLLFCGLTSIYVNPMSVPHSFPLTVLACWVSFRIKMTWDLQLTDPMWWDCIKQPSESLFVIELSQIWIKKYYKLVILNIPLMCEGYKQHLFMDCFRAVTSGLYCAIGFFHITFPVDIFTSHCHLTLEVQFDRRNGLSLLPKPYALWCCY